MFPTQQSEEPLLPFVLFLVGLGIFGIGIVKTFQWLFDKFGDVIWLLFFYSVLAALFFRAWNYFREEK